MIASWMDKCDAANAGVAAAAAVDVHGKAGCLTHRFRSGMKSIDSKFFFFFYCRFLPFDCEISFKPSSACSQTVFICYTNWSWRSVPSLCFATFGNRYSQKWAESVHTHTHTRKIIIHLVWRQALVVHLEAQHICLWWLNNDVTFYRKQSFFSFHRRETLHWANGWWLVAVTKTTTVYTLLNSLNAIIMQIDSVSLRSLGCQTARSTTASTRTFRCFSENFCLAINFSSKTLQFNSRVRIFVFFFLSLSGYSPLQRPTTREKQWQIVMKTV